MWFLKRLLKREPRACQQRHQEKLLTPNNMAGERNGKVGPIDNSDSDKLNHQKVATNNTKLKNITQSSKSVDNKLPSVESPAQKMELQNMCAYRPKSNSLSDMPCCGRLFHKTSCKVIIFLAVFLLDTADLFSDWFLYYHVSAAEEGLVYGPPDVKLRYSLLAFSILGSLTFTFEISNLWFEIFRNNPWVDIDLLSAITIWIEDVPQIVINVFIFACREEAISYFQLVKASLVIIGSVIRFVVFFVRYCGKRARFDLQCASVNPDSRRHVIYRVFIMVGCVLTVAGATAVFLFVQSERNPDGSLNFKVPNSLIEGEYDDQKYFQNVSVYFSHEMFDSGNTIQTKDKINLVRLLTINDIKRQQYDQIIKIRFDHVTGSSKVVIDTQGSVRGSTDCFQTNSGTNSLTYASSCASYIPTTNARELVFKFKFIKPSVPKLIFGDISYNVKVHDMTPGSACKSLDFSIKDTLDEHVRNSNIAALHYYRTSNQPNTDHVLLNTGSTTGKFYHSNILEDISEVWKTGFTNCESSGSMAPHYDASIPVDCN